jgi:hypothetical protein
MGPRREGSFPSKVTKVGRNHGVSVADLRRACRCFYVGAAERLAARPTQLGRGEFNSVLALVMGLHCQIFCMIARVPILRSA